MPPKKRKRRRPRPAGYFAASRSLAASFVFIAPLFALYQIGVFFDPRARNGTDPIYRELLHPFRGFGFVAVNLAVLGLLCLAIWRTRAERLRTDGLYGKMFAESLGWTIVLLGVALGYERLHLAVDPDLLIRGVTGSIGAGVYEETLFRFLLLGGMVLVLHRGLGAPEIWVVPFAIAVSAALFSQAHHAIGGEPWTLDVFLFRTAMGCVLGWLYWARGLGITVYAHAFYNVWVFLERLRHA